MPPFDVEVVRRRLDDSRKKLLDTSLRNRLINYRPSRASGVEFVGEEPRELFRLLVVEGRTMSFVGRPDPKKTERVVDPLSLDLYDFGDDATLARLREEAERELEEYLDITGATASPTDSKLNTFETETNLKNRLMKSWRDARLSLEEQGVNVLFLALGMLEWYEHGAEEPRRAPLVLVPVTLERTKTGAFRLKYDGTEIGGNLSLSAKLRGEYSVRLPELPEEDLSIDKFFDEVHGAISSQPHWRVDRKAAVLGFFSYAKYLMYRDLDGQGWPSDRKPWDHPNLGALLESGFDEDEPGLSEEAFLDPYRPVESVNEVCDADGSQTLAILEANSGRSMMIEGPPGTGKSQTITNLIAEAVGNGRKVLFVAEKMAALEVVFRRLTEAGLGDACLELHSNKASKRGFYEELRRTASLAAPKLAKLETELQMLSQAREALNDYSAAVNTPLDKRGVTPRDAMGRLISLGPETSVEDRFEFGPMEGWTQEEFKRKLDLVGKLEAKVRDIGVPVENPFYGSGLKNLLPQDRLDLLGAFERAAHAVAKARESSHKLAERLLIPRPEHLADIEVVCRCAVRAAEAPSMSVPLTPSPGGSEGGFASTASWHEHEPRLRAAISAGERFVAARERLASVVRPEAWSTDMSRIRMAFAAHGAKWYKFLIGDFRRAKSELATLLTQPSPTPARALEILEGIEESQRSERELADSRPVAERMFGVQWQGAQSDWAALRRLLDWVSALYRDIGSGAVPAGFLSFFDGRHTAEHLKPEADAAMADAKAASAAVREALRLLEMPLENPIDLVLGLDEMLETLQTWRQQTDRLQDLIQYNVVAQEAREQGLEQVVELGDRWNRPQSLSESFERCWYSGLMREAFASRAALSRFDRVAHERVAEEFRRLDRVMQEYNRAKVAYRHWQGAPRHSAAGSLGWLQRQYELRQSHKPIRVAMSKAGEAIQAIKPVFMMSPLSVAMYLPPDGPDFDLVIFDEASQVKPEDAFGAIARAAQMIVVGDSKQMPPTSFFDKLTGAESDEDEEADEEVAEIRELESILAITSSRLPQRSARRRDLRWHYRSKHDALITTSNRLFYGDRLVVFPNAERKAKDLGLVLHHNPSTVYGRGGSRKNLEEAKEVAKAALEHVRSQPHLTLGIAAFSKAQQEAIEEGIEALRGIEPAFAAFDERHPFEPLFVKNLENVQGDERDVIMISIGYGRDANGQVSMNFGPLNKDGGERRLNVLITRARVRCEVFTNMEASDIRVEEGTPRGVSALREFLHFAATGSLDATAASEKPRLSPFEEAVREALEAEGYSVVPQVGSLGFYVDLAVRHPEDPERFVLGIECDGEKYHSARSARDRDKLRQQVLEQRGWRIHRVWSTDWWHNPERELKRVVEAIGKALSGEPAPAPVPEPSQELERDFHEPVPGTGPSGIPYEVSGLRIALGDRDFADLPVSQLAGFVERVVRDESPVHVDELIRRIREAANLPRANVRVQSAIFDGLERCLAEGRVRREDEFLYDPAGAAIRPRDRRELPAASRKIDLVAPEELDAALVDVIASSFGIASTEACSAAARVLGWDRVTSAVTEGLLGRVRELVRRGVVQEREGELFCSL